MFAITCGIAFDLRYRVLVRRRCRQSRHYKLRRSIHRVNLSAFQLAGERVRRWRRINWTMLLTKEPLCSWLSKFTICVFLRVYEYGFVCMGVLAPILAGGVAPLPLRYPGRFHRQVEETRRFLFLGLLPKFILAAYRCLENVRSRRGIGCGRNISRVISEALLNLGSSFLSCLLKDNIFQILDSWFLFLLLFIKNKNRIDLRTVRLEFCYFENFFRKVLGM